MFSGTSFTTWLVFGLGILVGAVLFNKDFRYKFIHGIRSFLGQVGKGADNLNRQYDRQGRRIENPLDDYPHRSRHRYEGEDERRDDDRRDDRRDDKDRYRREYERDRHRTDSGRDDRENDSREDDRDSRGRDRSRDRYR